jgi:hypothetical protein
VNWSKIDAREKAGLTTEELEELRRLRKGRTLRMDHRN